MSTDAQVLQDVIEAFERIPLLRSSKFYIDVQRRVVTIRGRVPGELERQEAAHAARGIVGLRALVLEVAVTSKPTVRLAAPHTETAEAASS
jgi:osmotically-inducible protein OsmY